MEIGAAALMYEPSFAIVPILSVSALSAVLRAVSSSLTALVRAVTSLARSVLVLKSWAPFTASVEFVARAPAFTLEMVVPVAPPPSSTFALVESVYCTALSDRLEILFLISVSAAARFWASLATASALAFTWVSRVERLVEIGAAALMYEPSFAMVPILSVSALSAAVLASVSALMAL